MSSTFAGSDVHDDQSDQSYVYVGETEAQDPHSKSPVVKKTLASPYKAIVLPKEAALSVVQKKLDEDYQQNLSLTSAFVFCATPKSSADSDDVTEEYIKEFNSHRGNQEKLKQAYRMLYKTRSLAGLDSDSKFIDIPSARRNFFLLAQLDNKDLKMAALNNLILVLQQDKVTKETAFDLLDLAIDFMKQMDRELIQTQLIDEQIKICEAYGMVAELIQWHYGKKHIGGITRELHGQLVNTLRTLEDLNTQDNVALHCVATYALEGFKRLKDDRKELFELGERLVHLIIGIIGTYTNNGGYPFDDFTAAFKGLNVQINHSWYDAALLFNVLSKSAYTNPLQLAALQWMISSKSKILNWKFLYNALQKFGSIAIFGATPAIRHAAFKGQKIIKNQLPGLVDFIDCQIFKTKTNRKPLIHFKLPVEKDNNISIRLLTIEQLIKISHECSDSEIRKDAKLALLHCLRNEKDNTIIDALKVEIPLNLKLQKLWLNEEENYAYKVSTNMNTSSGLDLVPADPIEHIARQIITLYYTGNPTTAVCELTQRALSQKANSLTNSSQIIESRTPPITIKKKNSSDKEPPSTIYPKNSPSGRHSKRSSPSSKSGESLLLEKKISSKVKPLNDYKKFEGSKQAMLLSKTLNLDTAIIEQYIDFNQDIHLSEKGLLYVNEAGVKKILQMFEEIQGECTILDFSQCQIQEPGLHLLIKNLQNLHPTTLCLPNELNKDVLKELIPVIQKDLNLTIYFTNPEDDLTFGKILVEEKMISEAIAYFKRALDKLNETSDYSYLNAEICYNLAEAYILEKNDKKAEEFLLEANKHAPKTFHILSKLANFYNGRQNYFQASKFAGMALRLRPQNKFNINSGIDYDELIKIFHKHENVKEEN